MWSQEGWCCWNVLVRADLIERFNYVLEISYDGSKFSGSQLQPNKITVESVLKKYLLYFFKDLEKLIFAGRTDTGVHAVSQTVNFYSCYNLNLNIVINHINEYSHGIRVESIKIAESTFDSRRSARKRQYIYIFSNNSIPVYLKKYVSVISYDFNPIDIKTCLDCLLGIHDFAVFQKSGSSAKSTVREIISVDFNKFSYKVLTDSKKSIILNKVTIEGNAFLYRMIRNIMGAIFEVLKNPNKLQPNDFKNLIVQNKRIFNFKPAPAAGLYLNKIWY